MIDQLRALIDLRIAVFRHVLSPGKLLGAVLTTLFFAGNVVLAVALALLLFYLGARADSAETSTLIWGIGTGVFIFLWLWALLLEMQRSDSVDLRRMLYLPMSLRVVFLFNYAFSLITPGTVLFLLPALGLSLGLAFVRPDLFLSMFLASAFLLMLSAWTYYFRGLLAALMENRRRKRIIMTVLPIIFILVFQLPNLARLAMYRDRPSESERQWRERWASSVAEDSELPKDLDAMDPAEARRVLEEAAGRNEEALAELSEALGRRERVRERARTVLVAFAVAVPPAWLPGGVYALHTGRYGIAGLAFAGMTLLAAGGLGLGYRSTVRYYMGAPGRTRRARRERPGARERRMSRLVALRLPFLDDDTSAAAGASFVMLARHPQLALVMLMPLVFGGMFLSAFVRGGPSAFMVAELIPAAALVLPHLGLLAFLDNVFGTDREGFQVFALLPTERWRFLLAKNIALFPFAASVAVILILACGALRLYPLSTLVAGLLLIVPYYLALCVFGNTWSVLLPFPVSMDGMRRIRPGGFAQLVMLLSMPFLLLLAVPMAAVLYADKALAVWTGYTGPPVSPLLAFGLLAVSVLLYRAVLPVQGRLLAQRERQVLRALAREEE